jgi:hypothetical protein
MGQSDSKDQKALVIRPADKYFWTCPQWVDVEDPVTKEVGEPGPVFHDFSHEMRFVSRSSINMSVVGRYKPSR